MAVLHADKKSIHLPRNIFFWFLLLPVFGFDYDPPKVPVSCRASRFYVQSCVQLVRRYILYENFLLNIEYT